MRHYVGQGGIGSNWNPGGQSLRGRSPITKKNLHLLIRSKFAKKPKCTQSQYKNQFNEKKFRHSPIQRFPFYPMPICTLTTPNHFASLRIQNMKKRKNWRITTGENRNSKPICPVHIPRKSVTYLFVPRWSVHAHDDLRFPRSFLAWWFFRWPPLSFPIFPNPGRGLIILLPEVDLH